MGARLLISFLVGAVFFTVLPIHAPFVVLQTEEMPRFLLGLVAGAGALLALINGPARGMLLVLACASVGASIHVFVRQRRRNLAPLLLIGAIIAGIVGFVIAFVINLHTTQGPALAENIVFSVLNASIKSVEGAIIAALVMSLGGGVVFLLDRNRRGSANSRITLLQATFSWQVLVIAAGLMFLMSLSDVAQAVLDASPNR